MSLTMHPSAMRTLRALVVKDLRVVFRLRTTLVAMFVFAALELTVFALALPQASWRQNPESVRIAAGVMWVAIAFGGVLGLNQTFADEKDGGAFEGLLLTPVDRGLLYLSKFISNLVFLALVEVPLSFLFLLFFQIQIEIALVPLASFAGVLLLGTVGFTAAGTLFAAISAASRSREMLQPLLLLPIGVPILLAGTECLAAVLAARPLADVANWLRLMGVFDVVFLVGSFLTFEFLVEE